MTCPKRSQTAAHAYDTCEEHYGKDMNCDGFIGIDGDGDGYESEHTGGNDCDDYDATVHPGAVEIQGDNKDNNCNGRYNETISDDDGDGFANEDDCAPDDESIFPGAEDVAEDGIDQDCDGHDAKRVTHLAFNKSPVISLVWP